MNRKTLLKFEKEIGNLYEQGKIKSPIHLMNPSIKLIKIFEKYYKEGDWIFSTHRSHLHWLLSNRNPEELKKQILDGYSMHIFDNKFFTSAIVAGNAPIALGVAYALKLKNSSNKVLCFIGDMASKCGIIHECIQYAIGYELPIIFIIEDNSYSVNAKTKEIWKNTKNKDKSSYIIKYTYTRGFPHSGVGKYIMF